MRWEPGAWQTLQGLSNGIAAFYSSALPGKVGLLSVQGLPLSIMGEITKRPTE